MALDYFFFFNDPATTEIYTLSLHDALPISGVHLDGLPQRDQARADGVRLSRQSSERCPNPIHIQLKGSIEAPIPRQEPGDVCRVDDFAIPCTDRGIEEQGHDIRKIFRIEIQNLQ